MSEKKLDLKRNIGNTLQLQFSPQNNKDERFYVKLIGFLDNKSIIVTTPRFDGVAIKVTPEQKFIIRMMSNSTAQVFTVSAIHTTTHPYPHLHLTYPEKFESIIIRKAERVKCQLNVRVSNAEQGHSSAEAAEGLIQDISTAGGQLFAAESLGEVGDTLSINTKINIAELEQDLTLSGCIRRVVIPSEGKVSFEYGIEFVLLEERDKLLLHAYVYQQLLKTT